MEWMENLIGFTIIFGCGLGIYYFGVWSEKQQKPMGFWANGKLFDPNSVTDISGYIRAYSILFRRFSVPCMISGALLPINAGFSLVILILWGTIGIWWLIHSYKQIEKTYIMQ